jgi:ubiquinone/menaquinone biosynthesis C-methylase UbiE
VRKPLFIARQGRQPSGLLGRIVAGVMAKETASENALALQLLDLQSTDHVLEVGSGHGETLAKAARVVQNGHLCGLDFSPIMHRHALHCHRQLVSEGRIEFELGQSDALPFQPHAFDKVLTVHTIYFWADPLPHLREMYRVLRPGGRLVLGFRPAEDEGFAATYPAEIYNIRSEAIVLDLISSAGFESSELHRQRFPNMLMSYIVAGRSSR